jgi:hypothetical protein
VFERVKFVSAVTAAATLEESCAWTVTEKVDPAAGLAGEIDVMASFVALPAAAV